jgi:hypothetical protein
MLLPKALPQHGAAANTDDDDDSLNIFYLLLKYSNKHNFDCWELNNWN